MNLERIKLPLSVNPFSDNIILLAELELFSQLPFDCLSPEELIRADTIASPSAKQFYLNSRVLLRTFLAKFLDVTPSSLLLQYQPSGKPELVGHSLQFNVSHSHQWIGFAFSKHCIGLDLEWTVHQQRNYQAIARRFFAAPEIDFLSRFDQSELETQFFKLWTQKEAALKAHGGGIKTGLEKLDFVSKTHSINRKTYHVEHAQSVDNLHIAVATEQAQTETEFKNISSFFYILTPTLEIYPYQPPYKQNISLIPESL